MDTFVVNTFIYIVDEPYLVVSVDNFGMIVFDTITKRMVEEVNFRTLVPNLPQTFSINRFVPIGTKGIRVLLENSGGFSFLWRSIGKAVFH